MACSIVIAWERRVWMGINMEAPLDQREIRRQIKQERLRLIYEQMPRSFIPMLLVVTLIVVVLLAAEASMWQVAIWWLLMLGLTFNRTQNSHDFRKDEDAELQQAYWARVCFSSALVMGLGFGGASFFLALDVDIEYRLLTLMILAGIAGAALPFLTMHLPSFFAFLSAMTLPNAVWLFWLGGQVEVISAVLFVVYIGAVAYSAQRVHQLLEETLTLRFQNESLASSLQREKEHLELINNELERLSHVDGLTQLANRRYFDKRFNEEWHRSLRANASMALAILDIDYFKNYNDTYGHLAGDECLRKVADTIKATLLRPSDLAARYGGEEFVVLLSNTDAEGAYNVASEILKNICALDLPHASSKVEPFLTVSIGVAATIPERDKPRAYLLETADLALYKSKHAGRNRITVENLDVPSLEQSRDSNAKRIAN